MAAVPGTGLVPADAKSSLIGAFSPTTLSSWFIVSCIFMNSS